MPDELLIVNKKLLPKSYEKVALAKAMLNDGRAENVSDACKSVGISRGTFYKYQEFVFEYKQQVGTRKLAISFSLSHKTGSLSKVCDLLSKKNISILTISQSDPIGDIAPVMLSLDISKTKESIEDLKNELENIEDLKHLKVIAVE